MLPEFGWKCYIPWQAPFWDRSLCVCLRYKFLLHFTLCCSITLSIDWTEYIQIAYSKGDSMSLLRLSLVSLGFALIFLSVSHLLSLMKPAAMLWASPGEVHVIRNWGWLQSGRCHWNENLSPIAPKHWHLPRTMCVSLEEFPSSIDPWDGHSTSWHLKSSLVGYLAGEPSIWLGPDFW
jgi:hypothetical protein